MRRRTIPLEELEKRLGYEFSDKDLLLRALTHSSAVSPGKRTAASYQRLEFLGDRVLGLSVAQLLHSQLPNANEGELSRTLNSLVRRETCAAVALEINLGEFLRLGESEARTGGANKEAILADVCEAIIGAMHIDGGLDAASSFVERHFGAMVGRANAKGADAKTSLQEWAQGRGLEPPAYVETERTGPDHAPEFTISVQIPGYATETAQGTSKRSAEHMAAERFLRREGVWKASS